MTTDNEENVVEQEQLIEFVVNARRSARNQILYGLGWWVASSIAIAMSISSPDSSLVWFGGLIGAPSHWIRAYQLYSATRQVGAGSLIKSELAVALSTLVIIGVSVSTLAPEIVRVFNPGVGTCWSDNEASDGSAPVACWSPDADARAVAFATSPELCPSQATYYLEPANTIDPYTCLEDIN